MFYAMLIITLAIPPIGILAGLLGIYQNFRYWKICIFCIALGMASIAYCYYPKGDPDIIRYVWYIESLKGTSFYDAVASGIKGETNTFVFSFFCWVAAQINDPQIIPAVSTFFVYYCGMYVTCYIGADKRIKRSIVIAYVIFMLLSLNFYAIINNVRNVFAFSVVSFAIFRDMYQKKRNWGTWVLYIFPIFVHQSAVLIVLVRLAFNLAVKAKIVMLILVGAINTLASAAHKFMLRIQAGNIVVDLLKTFTRKADEYLNDTSSSWGLFAQKSLTLRIERLIDISFAVFISLLILFIIKKGISKLEVDDQRIKSMRNYSFIVCLLTISCTTMLIPGYWRFYSLAVLFSAVPYFEASTCGNKNIKLLANGIFLVTPVACAIWVKMISYSDLTALLAHPFISSPIIILIKDLFGLN